MWGRQSTVVVGSDLDRNTPTHVGKTKTILKIGEVKKKHPHACGEDTAKGKRPVLYQETPPRMWGRLSKCRAS